jgi:hypothetical protein
MEEGRLIKGAIFQNCISFIAKQFGLDASGCGSRPKTCKNGKRLCRKQGELAAGFHKFALIFPRRSL